MSDTAVTVVIPCYNHGRFVRQAVTSILEQTFRDVRVVVVDDGSTDPHTLEVMAALPGPRVTVLHQENKHVAAARNTGIRSSQSPVIVTLDADDSFEPDFLEKALPVLDADPAVGVVTCTVRNRDEREGTFTPSGGGIVDFLKHNGARASALFRRACWEQVGGYNETMRRGYEDWDFWIRVVARGWRVQVLQEPLLNYRCARQSMVTGADAIRPELIRVLAMAHLPLYREHVVEVLVDRERQIQSLERRLDELRGSLPCRLGRYVSAPWRALRDLWHQSRPGRSR